MLKIVPDTTSSELGSARVAEVWRKPKHGHGMLKPWPKGVSGYQAGKPTRYTETQQLARSHSVEAIQTLVERLRDPDGRIAVVAANSILERAWGRVREAKPEENKAASIDLSKLTDAELALLVQLADSGRLVAQEEAPTDGEPQLEGAPQAG